ncbi:MAG: PAS domain S-box protein [Chloroflexota bacterium]|nr:PAS domain S-box protein [Chloroflexota bacterium]
MPESNTRNHLDLSALFLSCPDPIIGETLDGVINFWNPAAEKLFGYSAQEAIGQPASLLAPAGHEADLTDLRRRALQGHVTEAYDTVLQPRDGGLRDVSLTIFPVRDDAGTIVGVSTTTRDITQRRRAASALAASERRFRAAFDEAPNGMALVGLDGAFLQVNRAVCEMLGFTEHELLALPPSDLMLPDELEQIAISRERQLATGAGTITLETRMLHRDGSPRLIRLQASLVRDDSGEPAYFIVQAQDLTEAVAAREKLVAARQQMQEVLERVGGAFIAVDSDWRITQVNAAAEELIGLPRHVLQGRVLQDVVDPSLLAPLLDALTTTMTARQRTQVAEFAYAPRDAWFTLRAYPIADGVSLFIRDITPLRDLEQELRIAEMRFQTLVEHLPAVVYMVADDGDETMIYLSPFFEELTGFSPERDAPLRNAQAWLDLIHPDDRERVVHKGETFDHRTNQVFLEYRLRRADGSYIWVSDTYAAMVDDAGRIIAWLGILIDVTESKEARDAVARLASIVEASDDAIFFRTLDGIFTYWNPAAERLYGYTADEAIGQSLTMLLLDKSETLISDPADFDEGPANRFISRHVRKDGAHVDVAVTVFPVCDAEGEMAGISGIVRDISDVIAAERELRAALEAAEAGERAKGLFLAMMSHELRTPLQAVLGYADFLLGAGPGALSAEQREDIGYIHQGAGRMVHLIEQMLDLSRMEAGRLELRREAVELRAVLELVRQDVAPQAEGKGLELTVVVPRALPAVWGDAERVRQIVLNLAGNAVKFTDAGGITIRARAVRGWVEIAVRDTGIGLAPADLAHIFEEFRQVDSTLSRRHGGAGLGLAIAQRLAAQMGGEIAVASTPGAGSTFTLRLPVATEAQEQARPECPPA